MANKISIVLLLAFSIALVKATTVDITQQWIPNFGWEITCSWNLYMNDSLQSVKLSKNKQQFMIFRPGNQIGSLSKKQSWNLVESVMNVECMEAVDSGIRGKCVFTVEPQLPPKRDFTFGCEVSGERPHFRMDEKEIVVEALIPPTDTVMTVTKQESGPSTINCTSAGLPAPTIMWTVDNKRIPHNFHGTPSWNATSKLWNVWSSYTPLTEDLENLQCTPLISKGNQVIKGLPATYNNAKRMMGSIIGVMILIVSSILLR